MATFRVLFDTILLASFFISLNKVIKTFFSVFPVQNIKQSNENLFLLLSLFCCFALNIFVLSFVFYSLLNGNFESFPRICFRLIQVLVILPKLHTAVYGRNVYYTFCCSLLFKPINISVDFLFLLYVLSYVGVWAFGLHLLFKEEVFQLFYEYEKLKDMHQQSLDAQSYLESKIKEKIA